MQKTKTRLLLLLLLCSCNCFSSNKSDEELKLPIPTDNIKTLKGEIVFPDLFLGRPHRMLIVKNNLLILDTHEGKSATVVDLSNPTNMQRIASVGQGPNDFLRLMTASYHEPKNAICFYDSQGDRMVTYKVENNQIKLNEKTRLSSVRLKDRGVGYGLPLGNQFISHGAFEDKQFALFDNKGESLSIFGVYPGEKDGIQFPMAFFLKTQGQIVGSPDQKHFAIAGAYHDQLTFYKATGNIPQKIKEYFSEEPKVSAKTTVRGETTTSSNRLDPDSRSIYTNVYGTNNNLYLLYRGVTPAEREASIDKPCAILVFNWDGSIKQAYKIPHTINSFAIDETNRCLYAVRVIDEEPYIMKYQL